MTDRRLALDDGSLVDVLDRLVSTGAVVDGTVVVTLAGVDLARLDLKLLLTSVLGHHSDSVAPPLPVSTHAHKGAARYPKGTDDRRQAGVAGLVLVVVDLVRRLLERLALRRMDAGELSGEEVERLGRALMSLEEQTEALAEVLGTTTVRRST